MKALKSRLAQELLSDPIARAKLRDFFNSYYERDANTTTATITFNSRADAGKGEVTRTVTPRVVPKARTE